VNAFHWAFGAAVILSALATIGSFMIRDEDAKATMAPRVKAQKPVEQAQPQEEAVLAH